MNQSQKGKQKTTAATTRITKLSFAVFFAALAIVFIAGLSLLTPTVTYGADEPPELEGRQHACPSGQAELQEGQCVSEPFDACPPGYDIVGDEPPFKCGILTDQERPICPEGSTDIDEREDIFVCIDDVTGEEVTPTCASEDAILVDFGENLFFCNTYDFTEDRIPTCGLEGSTMNEEGQCVSRPGRIHAQPG